MRKAYFKYFTAVFFTVLFLSKGLVSVAPGLFSRTADLSVIEQFMNTEKGDENKNAEEKIGQEVKEVYLHNSYYIHLLAIQFTPTEKIIHAKKILYEQTIPAIPTPPPEFS
jgi:hypothetical protein